jgi:glycerol-3-phosphate dehydrogenase
MVETVEQPYDVAIIGGGVVGCATFRAFCLAGARTILLERNADILNGASKGNSAILHSGFDADPGSLELACIRSGYAEYRAIHARLNLPILETTGLVVAWSEDELVRLPRIVEKAHRNGALEVTQIDRDGLLRREPNLAGDALGAVLVPGEHVIDPWSAPLAYALQGIANGGTLRRRAGVGTGRLADGRWSLETASGPVAARVVVNCAGLQGDLVEAIARPSPFRILPRKGQFVVFDKPAAELVNAIILPVPTERTKGVVLARTVFGNLLVGPTAEDQIDREASTVEQSVLAGLVKRAGRMVPSLAETIVTAVYAGLRPATESRDFRIEAVPDRRWITVGGIRSTGLTAALGIAGHATQLYQTNFGALPGLADPVWTPVPNLAEHDERPYRRPGHGEIVCHCEWVTRSEIEAAFAGPLPAGDLGGLKRRTRCMMGRCQGFYCSAGVMTLAAGRLPEMPAPARP